MHQERPDAARLSERREQLDGGQAPLSFSFDPKKGIGGNLAPGVTVEAIDLSTGEYRPAAKVDLPSGVRDPLALLSSNERLGQYAWKVMGPTLAYAAGLIPEIADDIVSADTAMKLGFGWKWGPFELIDQLGAKWLADRLGDKAPDLLKKAAELGGFYRIEAGKRQFLGTDGAYHDVVRPEGVLLLEDIKLKGEPLLKNGSAALWDIGDGVVCLEFTSKMNAMDEQILSLLKKTIDLVKPEELGVDPTPRLHYLRFEEPPKRQAGVKLGSVAELVDKLKNTAGVL